MSDNTMEMSLADLPSVFSSDHSGKQSQDCLLDHSSLKQALSGIDDIKASLRKSGSGSDKVESTFKVDTISIDSNIYKKEALAPNNISENNEMAQAFARVKGRSIKDRDGDLPPVATPPPPTPKKKVKRRKSSRNHVHRSITGREYQPLRRFKSESSVGSVSELAKGQKSLRKTETQITLESVTETAEQVNESILNSPGLHGKKHFARSSETGSVTQTMDIIENIYMPKLIETSFETDSQTRTEVTETMTTAPTNVETSYLSDTSLLTSDAVTTDCTSQDESETEDTTQRTSGNKLKRVAQGPNFGFEGSYLTVIDPRSLFNDF